MPDKAALFRELARVLKPGGRLGGMDWIQRPYGDHQTEAEILRSGDDLLAPATRTPRALTRYTTVLAEAGVVPAPGATPVCWSGGSTPEPRGAPEGCAEELKRLDREERAYTGLLDWNVRRQAIAARGRPRAASAER